MTPIERELRTLLDERASSYDVRAAMPRSVARRARTYRAATAGAAGALVAAIVTTAFLAPGGVTSAERVQPVAPSPAPERTYVDSFSASADSDPSFDARRADIVATGRVEDRRWVLSAERRPNTVCLTLEVPRMSMSSCGGWGSGEERPLEAAARVRVRKAGMVGVFGYAATSVARVTVTTQSGAAVRARLAPTGARLPRPAQLWVAFVPRGERMTVVAEDAQGRTLARERLGAYAGTGGP